MLAEVVKLHRNDKSDVSKSIHSWLRSLKQTTRSSREEDIKQFFWQVYGLNFLEQIKEKHLYISRDQFLDYHNWLKEKYKKSNGDPVSSTVNRKLASIRVLFGELAISYKFIDMTVFKMKRESDNSESYGELTLDEAKTMIDLAMMEKMHPYEKSVLIELAIMTGIRQSALLRISYTDIKMVNGWWVVEVVDKGSKKDKKPITKQLFERIFKLKDMNGDQLFKNMTDDTCLKMVKRFAKKIGITDRNIVFHSLKAVGINYAIDIMNNVQAAIEHGNHKKPETTLNNYHKRKENFAEKAGIKMFEDVESFDFSDMSKEELVIMISSLSDTDKRKMLHQVGK